MKLLQSRAVAWELIARSTAMIAMVGFISGCATQNLADNPVNRAAGVLASALAGVNRTVARGMDSMDRNLMSIQYSPAGAANEYFMSAELGTRQETGAGPNPDTTYRPALASKANAVCKGQFRLLNERNPQVSIAFQRQLVEKRVEREIYNRTGTGGYGVPEISGFDRLLLNTYPEAGLVWHIRCGEGPGWSAPPQRKFDVTTVPVQDRKFVGVGMQQIDRLVGNVPPLASTLYPKALLLVPTEIAMKDLILRSGSPNPQTTVLIWAIGMDGLSRGVQRRKIFDVVETEEASRLPVSSDGKVVVYFGGDDLGVLVPGKPAELVRINVASYEKFVAPRGATALTTEEGMELVVRVVEDAARRAAQTGNR